MGHCGRDHRGVSPVIGVVLLVAIVVVLAAVSAGMLFAISQEPDPAPNVAFSIEAGGAPGEYAITHDNGDRVDGGNLELRGAADPETLNGSELSAGRRETIHAVEETVEAVWFGDDGTSYVIWEFDLEADADPERNTVPGVDGGTTVPEPDAGCDWVEEESDDGTEDVKVDGLTVNCDVETEKVIEVQDGGVVMGDTLSNADEVDADDAAFYGDVDVEDVFNLQDGLVTGSVTSETDDVKLDNGTVGGSVTADKTIELTTASSLDGRAISEGDVKVIGGSSVGGDAVSDDGQVKVDNGTVSGEIATDGNVKLQDATVDGDAYVTPSDFDCTDSTVNGQDCGEYDPRDPDDY